MTGPRKLAAFIVIAYLLVHVLFLAYIALPSLGSDLRHDSGPGNLYNSLITSDFRIDRVFYFAIAPLFTAITLTAFWKADMQRRRAIVIMLCVVGIALLAIIYVGFAVLADQRELWQLANLTALNSHATFAARTTSFCVQSGTVFVAILSFAAGASTMAEWTGRARKEEE